MRKIAVAFTLLLVAVSAYSQTKKEDVRALVVKMGSGDIGIQVVEALIPEFQKMLPDVPREYWEKMKGKIRVGDFVELIIPIYDKYYTHEEIKELIRFYDTDVGKKTIQIMPQMTQESMQAGQEWGRKIAEEIYSELKKDGYVAI